MNILSPILSVYNLRPFPKQALVFTCLLFKSLENAVDKGGIARNEQFLLFPHSVFYPFGELSAIFIKLEIIFCRLLQFGRILNMSFGKGFNFNGTQLLIGLTESDIVLKFKFRNF